LTLRRIELEESGPGITPAAATLSSEPIVTPVGRGDLETSLLPRDHPRWVRDAVAVSQRARALIAGLRPVVVRVLTFWDHRLRSILVGDRRVRVDPSGCYRTDF